MVGAPRYVTASVREKTRKKTENVGQSLCCCLITSQSDTGGYSSHPLALQLTNTGKPTPVCSVVRFYSFVIVHLCVQDRNRTAKKKAVGCGGGDLTKRVGGITKSPSAETRASNPH